ncbi:hypothetical protein GCM10007301_45990 [Azorhizobium oxalatiphilum]|uniref:Thioesterase domain-containing protein n=1 Tax=Azorhizobium oxalatiphilum TaxID=980631 RepID=A0A917FHC7_9HYPH|nr:hypothetical protein [Azorhizobium oxalatiphilum]GGF80692.1 hypothetical protein GCM10007301_45990 [Azorhizobium oxalatiphilum]
MTFRACFSFRPRFAFPRFLVLAFSALLLSIAIQGSASAQTGPRVYLMRGLANVFSTGMDTLAGQLQAKGIRAEVYEYGQWQELANDAVAWSRANRRAPVVIVGHSLGADAAIQMAERMTAMGIAPRLVVTFDPVGVTTVGRSGGRFVNIYQSNNGFGKALTKGPGFTGTLVNRNENAASAQGIDHFNIEKAEAFHQQVIAMVRALSARPKPRPQPAPVADPAAPSASLGATPATASAAGPAAEKISATPAATPATAH